MAAFFVIRSSEVWTSVEKRKKYPLFRRYPWAIRPAAQGALQLPRACKMSAGTAFVPSRRGLEGDGVFSSLRPVFCKAQSGDLNHCSHIRRPANTDDRRPGRNISRCLFFLLDIPDRFYDLPVISPFARLEGCILNLHMHTKGNEL